MRKILVIITVMIAGLAALAVLTPWKTILEGQIHKALAAQGFSDVSLRVSGWGLHGIVLDDLRFGADAPLRFRNVSVDYSWESLRARRLEGLTIAGPSLLVKKREDKWVIEGMADVLSARADAPPLSVASLTATLQRLPFDKIGVVEGGLTVSGDDMDASLPLAGQYQKREGKLTYKADSLNVRKGNITATTGNATAEMTLDPAAQSWQGAWQVDKIGIEGAAAPVPPLSGAGTIVAAGNDIKVNGQLQSADRSYQVRFSYEYSFAADKAAMLTIESAVMPWKEGRLRLAAVKIPMSGPARDLRLNVQADNISVDALLGAVTGKRVQATGTISGFVPVTLRAGGDILFHRGSLKTSSPGKIVMPPDAIPGDNQQIALVREILADLNYTSLSIAMDNDQKNDLGILMTVEGNNPAVYKGRAVKLNVNLTGDVLDFIRQNVMLLTRPEALWEQENER